MMDIQRVGVVGGGTMGSGIAEVCARAGLDTTVVEIDAAAVEGVQRRIAKSLGRAQDRGRITAEAHDAALANLSYSHDLADLADSDLVVEAVIENLDEKRRIFGLLDTITPSHAILASNTSSIAIIDLAAATDRPNQVVGMHFFNPAPVQPLVEVVRSVASDSGVVDAVVAFGTETLGKHVIRCEDRAGFVVNRLLVPYLLAAIELADSGQASYADIDAGMKHGCSHPMGPLELCDLIGLDVIEAVAEVMHAEYAERLYAPPPLLRRMVAAGRLGRKTGAGFYEYS
ncbi:MAG: 3-hydroxybutyryl-CoA dehydrogenase [bacterium]|nr:3-hydroxybutyryl-CoA dehydrogenase [bacterium]